MNNSDLAVAVAVAHEVSQKDAKAIVDTVMSNIAAALGRGDEVSLHGFGKFTVKSREARDGRNPLTGESIRIAASKNVGFKAAKGLKDQL